MSTALRKRLTGGPKRSLGEADAVAAEALRNPSLINQLTACLQAPEAEVRERSANALKKIVADDPILLQPAARLLLSAWKTASPLTVRWNLTLVVGKLRLKPRQRLIVIDLLFEALDSVSIFERTFAMQALADLAEGDDALRERLRSLFTQLTEHGTASMRARGRKLLRQLNHPGTEHRHTKKS